MRADIPTLALFSHDVRFKCGLERRRIEMRGGLATNGFLSNLISAVHTVIGTDTTMTCARCSNG
jgi:hypothetical protein